MVMYGFTILIKIILTSRSSCEIILHSVFGIDSFVVVIGVVEFSALSKLKLNIFGAILFLLAIDFSYAASLKKNSRLKTTKIRHVFATHLDLGHKITCIKL